MRFLKLILAIGLVVVAAFIFYHSAVSTGLLPRLGQPEPVVQTTTNVPGPPIRNVDLVALRSQIRANKDYALAAETQALAAYDAANAPSVPWYSEGRTAVVLYIYRTVGEDFFKEGLLQTADAFAAVAYKKGCRDPLILTICDVSTFQMKFSLKMIGSRSQLDNCHLLLQSNYPRICKADAAIAGLRNTATIFSDRNRNAWKEDMTPAKGNTQTYISIALDELGKMIAEGCPESLVCRTTDSLVSAANRSPEIMQILEEKVDPTLAAVGASSNVRALCRGSFLTEWAWTARGSGWSDSVTPEGWRLMEERLEMAQKVLEEAQASFPENPDFPAELLSVELGQGIGKDRMEKLFAKAIALEPGHRGAYAKKMYYLQPRWHGSPREVIDFGLACIDTGRWSDRIPLVFVEGIDLVADQDESVYQSSQIWDKVSYVFQEYLKRYPGSVHYRSQYLKWAVKTKNWDTAREQRALLGDNWDRSLFSVQEYLTMTGAIPKS